VPVVGKEMFVGGKKQEECLDKEPFVQGREISSSR
jgi:hypothetical protein